MPRRRKGSHRRQNRRLAAARAAPSPPSGHREGKAPSRDLYEVLIVGAGPASLACVVALLDSNMQSLLKYDNTARDRKKASSEHGARVLSRDEIRVVDASSSRWMARWKSQFTVLDIGKLRSPINHHPDPFGENALIEYALLEKNLSYDECGDAIDGLFREGSSKLLRKKAGRTVSRIRPVNNADQFKFMRPHTSLYHDFCDRLIEKHRLEDVVVNDWVVDVKPCHDHPLSDQKKPLLRVDLQNGSTMFARNVVLAVGNTCTPRIPRWTPNMKDAAASRRCEHVWSLAKKGPRYAQQQTHGKRVLVIGGGLSAVQAAAMAHRNGAKSVVMMARRRVQVRDFDVPVSWFGATKNLKMCRFLQTSSFEQRSRKIREARGPATVPKGAWMGFQTLQATAGDTLRVLQGFEVKSCSWDSASKCWAVSYGVGCEKERDATNIVDPGSDDDVDPNTMHVDYILLATGCETSVEAHPLFRRIASHTRPIDIVDGQPVLTSDLRWNPDLNLFVTGGYAALQLGPMAHILAGAQRGAAIVRDAVLGGINTEESKAATAKESSQGDMEHGNDKRLGTTTSLSSVSPESRSVAYHRPLANNPFSLIAPNACVQEICTA